MAIRSHIKTIPIRYKTPSRREINLVVAQHQDMLGHWQMPTITFNGPLAAVLESGRYARDVGMALIVASFYYDQMVKFVSNGHAAEKLLEDVTVKE